jgi:hypothetical protein
VLNNLKVKELCVIFLKTNINIVVIIIINNRLFSTHTHACEFMISKTSWHKKEKWHAMTNIGAINSKHTKTYGVTKNHGLP